MALFAMMTVDDGSDSVDQDILLRRIGEGDREALGELYRQTHTPVYAYALSILKNDQDAQDVLHDTYLAVVKGAAKYRGRGKARSWMYTIAHNLCIGKLRERKKTDDLPAEDWELLPDRREGITAEDRLVLEVCMQRLAEDERQIVMLHAVAEMKHREIADLLRLPLSTVLSKYRRALAKLKHFMEQGVIVV